MERRLERTDEGWKQFNERDAQEMDDSQLPEPLSLARNPLPPLG